MNWVINMKRKKRLTQDEVQELIDACKAEANERRIYHDRAIANCEVLIVELELASRELDVSADKYKQYIAMLDEEVGLLKGWRKSDNKRFKDLK